MATFAKIRRDHNLSLRVRRGRHRRYLSLGLLIWLSISACAFAQIKTQQITSSTGKVMVNNVVNSNAVTVVDPGGDPVDFDGSAAQSFVFTVTRAVFISRFLNPGKGLYSFSICQDGVGGHTFVWPSNFSNSPTISGSSNTVANTCVNVVGFYDGTNFRITGQWNTSGGGGGGSGVTSVGVQGDGTVENTALTNSPVTSSGTMVMSLVPAASGTALMGPATFPGTNVGVRQDKSCVVTSGSTTAVCAFSLPVVAGNWLAAVLYSDNDTTTGSISASDSLGNTLTFHGGAQVHSAEGSVSTAGTDTITLTANSGNFGTHNPTIVIFELVGVSAWHAEADCEWNVGLSGCTASSVTPSAGSDGMIEVLLKGQGSGTYLLAQLGINPAASLYNTYSLSNGVIGKSWIYSTGTTSAFSPVFSGPGLGLSETFAGIVLDFVQGATQPTAPPTYRKINSGDVNGLVRSGADGLSAGTVTLSGGAGSYTFKSAYTTAPICTATDQTAANAVKATSSTTAITLTGTTTDVVAWTCAPASN